ncbi:MULTISPECIES: EF-hand domain-containing protein [unclassified Kitasatospora]|uniref:EF-hand domain-containing protein n=1 Tax=unclassified Kitasatospora TaxID=2633591 RepID=UPI0033CC40DC
MSGDAHKKAQFDEIDTDGDGFISAMELKTHLQKNPKVSEANAEALFKIADENDDEQISFEEFAAVIR